MNWLQERQVAAIGMPVRARCQRTRWQATPRPAQRAGGCGLWLSKKYKVAPEPLSVLVAEAYDIGTRTKLDPTLILAIMAIESNFNPFAQSRSVRKA